ncbi:hypothetical protein LCGC14_2588220, partial [marine sediment metagenome]
MSIADYLVEGESILSECTSNNRVVFFATPQRIIRLHERPRGKVDFADISHSEITSISLEVEAPSLQALAGIVGGLVFI